MIIIKTDERRRSDENNDSRDASKISKISLGRKKEKSIQSKNKNKQIKTKQEK